MKQSILDKKFKQRGYKPNDILRPRPELDGLPRKVDYKKLCAELKEKEEKSMGIKELIKNLRETDSYIETIFMQGGCYKFHLFLKSLFPDSMALINKDEDHIITRICGEYYDITGEVSDSGYCLINKRQNNIVEGWTFSGRMFLSIGECKYCEEPVLV